MIYLPKNFILQEFVGPDVFDEFGERAWQFLDIRAIESIDKFRDFIGKSITINNWHVGGDRKESGLRIPGYEYHKKFSQHSFGRAFDHLVDGMEPSEVQEIWIENADRFRIGGIEKAKTWTHVDWRQSEKLVIFTP